MKTNTLGILIAAMVIAVAGWCTQSVGGESPAGVKVSRYAPADDLLAQVELFVERAEDSTDLLVEVGGGAVVGSGNPPDGFFVVAPIETEKAAKIVHCRMVGPGFGRPLRRQWHVF